MADQLVGTLTERISIVKIVKTSSNSGAPIEQREEVFSLRAGRIEMSVKENDDDKVRAIFSDGFVVRYRRELTKGRANGMFVIDEDGFEYNIIEVIPKVRKKYSQINTVRRE